MGLMPAFFAACVNSTAPCKFPVSASAMADRPRFFASATNAFTVSVELRNE
jgi:hypothetical protein